MEASQGSNDNCKDCRKDETEVQLPKASMIGSDSGGIDDDGIEMAQSDFELAWSQMDSEWVEILPA